MKSFAKVQSGKLMTIENCIDMLIYPILYRDMDLDERYGELVITLRLEECQTYSLHIRHGVCEEQGKREDFTLG